MQNIVNIKYAANGKSTNVNDLGMREMQEQAYEARSAQYLLLKAPPASGKSRALMYIALDKLKNNQVAKVIVAVPERSIGGSFSNTDLRTTGFHSDWDLKPEYNLCIVGGESGKVAIFNKFLDSKEKLLLCTHATLRFAFDLVGADKFNNSLIGIDEFHHVSAAQESRLGELVRSLMLNTNAHILAMTGSYFRGDRVPVLMPEDEAKFFKVTYNYYQQLNGYTYLKSLGIGYHFYQGNYLTALNEILNTDQKTILHIPNVNSGESTKDKLREVDEIIDKIGQVIQVDTDTKIISAQRADGKRIKIADLVNDEPLDRDKTIDYLRNMSKLEDIDLIIALGMAKEGFNWPYCEHALTVGYRGSLTEIIQIIGRSTRDCYNKTHAQFTNLVAEPDIENEDIIQAVNNMLKAITASLLMEEVLTPNFNFKSKTLSDDAESDKTIKIKGFKEPSTELVRNIIASDLTDLKAHILQDNEIQQAIPGTVDPEVINKVLIPKVIKTRYPHLDETQIEEVRQYVVVDAALKHAEIVNNGIKFNKFSEHLINIDDLDIDLIDQINPFQNAFEILSKSLTPKVLRAIQQSISAFKISVTDDEALLLWPKINNFIQSTGRHPNLDALDPTERRFAEVIVYLRQRKIQNGDQNE